jgi:formamidopyrimidine-DNA glycosylase
VREVSRRGKWLKLLLDDQTRIFSHLGMTGWWVAREKEDPKERSERARIDTIRNGHVASIRYLDSRRFGRLITAQDDIPEWTSLGPDPLLDGLDVQRLSRALAPVRRPIKDAIMDQSLLAGIGNILATEGLWHARIDPSSPSDALSRADIGKVVRGLRTAIQRQLAFRNKHPTDEPEAREAFAVYGRAGAPCPRCGTIIARTVIGGRSTTFCPHCQVRRQK